MILEKLGVDLSRIDDSTLQRMIESEFRGADFNQALEEYATLRGRYRHVLWVRTLGMLQPGEDLRNILPRCEFERDESGALISYYRYGGTSCQLDGAPIKNVLAFRYNYPEDSEPRKESRIRCGSICAQKIIDKNYFGETVNRRYTCESREKTWKSDAVIASMLEWMLDAETFQQLDEIEQKRYNEVLPIVKKFVEGDEVSEFERDKALDFYINTRRFHPSELIGEDELLMLRQTFRDLAVSAKRRRNLPQSFRKVVWEEEQITISEAEPVLDFLHSPSKQAIDELVGNDVKLAQKIERERRTLNSTYVASDGALLEDMCGRVLEYVKTYEEVNRNRRHGLTRLVLPMQLYRAGWIMTQEDAHLVRANYERHKNFTREELERRRDIRLEKNRRRAWETIQSNENYERIVKRNWERVLRAVEHAIDRSGFAKDIWKIINGTVASKRGNTRTGYVTKEELIGDERRRSFFRSNLRRFLTAGYRAPEGRQGFIFQDDTFYTDIDESIELNFIDAILGNAPIYVLPERISQIDMEDAEKIARKRKREFLRENRMQIRREIERVLNEVIRGFKPAAARNAKRKNGRGEN